MNRGKMNEKNFTVEEVAEICRVTPYTIREWLKDPSHELTGIKPAGRWLVPESNLKTYLESIHG
jgi:excisionase family DNA binding protein